MSDKHFDVVVLGRSMGAMCAAALLARRDFRVLVLGQGCRPCGYQFRGMNLRRRAFTFLCATSPAFKRITVELAQSQVFRRHLVAIDPMLSILMPGRRFELPPDLEMFQREVDREFTEVRRIIDDLYADLARVNAIADAVFERDLCWPPGTFWERRETDSAAAALPYIRSGDRRVFVGDFPPNHPYLQVVVQSSLFESNLAATVRGLPAFAIARLHGAWSRGLFGVPDGEDEVVEFLRERITALGCEVMFQERAVALNVSQQHTHELLLDGQLSSVSAAFVVTDDTGESLAQLAQGQGVVRAAQRRWPLVVPRAGRFVVSIVVRNEGLPAPLGAEAFIFTQSCASSTEMLSPVIHLQRTDRILPPQEDGMASDTTLLVAETLIPTPGNLAISDVRELVVNTVLSQFPYMDRHLVVVDSVYDGLPVWIYDNGKRSVVDRMEAKGATTAAEPMPTVLSIDPPGYFGIGGEPLRGPIPRTFLVGKSVMPALGQEGELLAAWGVARIITRSDRHRERMRRDMWSRMDLG